MHAREQMRAMDSRLETGQLQTCKKFDLIVQVLKLNHEAAARIPSMDDRSYIVDRYQLNIYRRLVRDVDRQIYSIMINFHL